MLHDLFRSVFFSLLYSERKIMWRLQFMVIYSLRKCKLYLTEAESDFQSERRKKKIRGIWKVIKVLLTSALWCNSCKCRRPEKEIMQSYTVYFLPKSSCSHPPCLLFSWVVQIPVSLPMHFTVCVNAVDKADPLLILVKI